MVLRDKARGGGIAIAMVTTSNAVSQRQTERELIRISGTSHTAAATQVGTGSGFGITARVGPDEAHAGTGSGVTELDDAAVRGGDALHDVQSVTVAPLFGQVRASTELFLRGRWQPVAMIANAQLDGIAAPPAGQLDRWPTVAYGIVEQIVQ